MTAAEFKYLAMVLFGGFAIFYGLWGIFRRELSFGLRGSLAHKYQIILRGNYAIGGGVGVIVAGLLFVLPALIRNQLDLSDALIGVLDVAGLVVLISSLVLASIFQFATNLGRDLSKQPDQEE